MALSASQILKAHKEKSSDKKTMKSSFTTINLHKGRNSSGFYKTYIHPKEDYWRIIWWVHKMKIIPFLQQVVSMITKQIKNLDPVPLQKKIKIHKWLDQIYLPLKPKNTMNFSIKFSSRKHKEFHKFKM